MKLLRDFEVYLQKRHYARTTMIAYTSYVHYFLDWTQQQGILPTQVRYADLLLFLQYCQKQGKSRNQQRQHTTALRHLFRMLRRQNQMNYNPAEGLFIIRRAKRLPHDLLPMDELRALYESYSGPVLRKLLLSLVVFQAIRREELGQLRIEHLHLKEGRVVVPSTPSSNRRVLKLSTEQIIPFHEWTARIHGGGKSPHDRLFLSPQGSPSLNNVIQQLLYQLRQINPEVRHLQQIRQSVIAHWLKSQDVRQVQYLAGHKWVSSTERYQQTDLEDLQNKLDKYHPLQ